MDVYYEKQIRSPYFSGVTRQRGSGFGPLALAFTRFARPLFTNVLLPAAKRFGRNLAVEALPEVVDMIDGKTSLKRATKKSFKKAARKTIQTGSGQRPRTKPKQVVKRKHSRISRKQNVGKRSRYDILANIKN